MTPFQDPLPEGVTWAEVTDDDRQWFAKTHPSPASTLACIRITIRIRRTADGMERVFVDEWHPFDADSKTIDELQDHIRYQWTDGNFGCDCNRGNFFARAGGETELDHDCGDEAYRIVSPAWIADLP